MAHRPYLTEGPEAQTSYGFGIVVEDHPCIGRICWHNGSNGRFSAHWRDYADQDFIALATSLEIPAKRHAARPAARCGDPRSMSSRAEAIVQGAMVNFGG
jgi:ribose 1,5-bisphosphokinase PhnN